ncbi:hypothetical protein QJS66_07205 [Kocuria rhizophila]|nr:hypothetical protein QJS66_07205 [Kocuria rhizophila]
MATPYLVRPIERGAASRLLGHQVPGGTTAIGGFIVDAGASTMARTRSGSGFNQPDPTYNGWRVARDLGADGAFGVNLSYVLKAGLAAADLGTPIPASTRAPHRAGDRDPVPARGVTWPTPSGCPSGSSPAPEVLVS